MHPQRTQQQQKHPYDGSRDEEYIVCITTGSRNDDGRRLRYENIASLKERQPKQDSNSNLGQLQRKEDKT
jgi:hypothetical protein